MPKPKTFKNKQMPALIEAAKAISEGKDFSRNLEDDPLWKEVITEMFHYQKMLESKLREDKRKICLKLAECSSKVDALKEYLIGFVERRGGPTEKTTIAKTLLSRNYSVAAFKLFGKTILLARTRNYKNRRVKPTRRRK